jgi:mannobiose 2-epimerase
MRLTALPSCAIALLLCAGRCPAADAPPFPPPTPEAYRGIAVQVEANLARDVLAKWFPAAVDRDAGGFYENFREDWSRGPTGQKSIVYQSRLTWLSAQAAARFPDRSAEYLAATRHGVAALADKLWDKDKGGFFWAVDDAGRPTRERGDEKHAYGIAFGIYAAASSHAVTKDAAALELAQRAFRWLDRHAHDARNGGYFEALTGDGHPILSPAANRPAADAIGTAYGRKSMNTHIHLLEAMTALHAVWPEPAVRARLAELHDVVLTRIYADRGSQHLYLSADWKPVPGPDSYGHDVETAFLLAESAEALGKRDDPVTWRAARRLVDHALDAGFDHARGGFYYEGAAAAASGHARQTQKVWWVQAEGLNALLLMHERFGRETPRYWEAFAKTWAFVSKHQVDAKHGGWHNTVSAEGAPTPGRAKSDRWTEGYHQGRALLTVSARLRNLADGRGHE